MPKLSIISHFYNSPEKVEQQVAHWKRIDAHESQQVEFLLVDDCSTDIPKISKGAINLRLLRVITDIPWNQAGARNLATFNATGEWGLFFDIDQRINLETVAVILANLDRLDKQTLYYLRANGIYDTINDKPMSNHPSTFLVNMQQFRVHGRYDEDFAGYYGYEDLYMPRVWEASGCKRSLINDPVFFNQLEFGTVNLDRDLERNNQLALHKLNSGCKNSPGILRFEWEEVVLC